jgi:hypothetical protein
MMDRQQEIGGQIVGGGDTFDEAAPGLALGQQQSGLGKSFGLQLLLDPLRKAQIEDKLGNVAGADRAFRFGGMSDIQNDPEFCGVASGSDRLQGGRVQLDRPQRGKLYGVALWRDGALRQFGWLR